MKPLSHKGGSAIIEYILSIPLILGLFFLVIHLSFLTLAKQITQWACYQSARTLLANSAHHLLARRKAQRLLRQIPMKKSRPRFQMNDSGKSVTVSIKQPVVVLGKRYEIQETFSLYR